jgi:hypothetical protein
MRADEQRPGLWERMGGLPIATRLELLEVLTAERTVRADILSRVALHPSGRTVADLLRSLEAEALIQPA